MEAGTGGFFPVAAAYASSTAHGASVVCTNFDPEEEILWVGFADVRSASAHLLDSMLPPPEPFLIPIWPFALVSAGSNRGLGSAHAGPLLVL